MNHNEASIRLLNEIGKWKLESDKENNLTILEAIVEYSLKEDIDLDDIIDILSDSKNIKPLIEDDLSSRGMIYIDGIRVKKDKMEEWK